MTIRIDDAATSGERCIPLRGQVDEGGAALGEVFRWVKATVDQVLKTGEQGRCVECKEPVRAHRGSIDGMAPHFEHHARNPKCSRSDTR